MRTVLDEYMIERLGIYVEWPLALLRQSRTPSQVSIMDVSPDRDTVYESQRGLDLGAGVGLTLAVIEDVDVSCGVIEYLG